MAKVEIMNSEETQTFDSQLTSTCLEVTPEGNKLFTLVFEKMALTFNESEYSRFRKDLGEFYLESLEEEQY